MTDISRRTKATKSKSREFVENYWFTNKVPSKAVTTILEWIEDGKLTPKGKQAYKKLCISNQIHDRIDISVRKGSSRHIVVAC